MKKFILFIVFASVFSFNTYSSSFKLKLNEPKTENATNYIIHKVAKGETLKSIAKNFHVPVREIAKLNENVYSNVSSGQKIKIPRLKKYSFPRFVSYKLAKGEGVQSLYKKFNTNEAELALFNPEASENFTQGHEIKLPTEFYRSRRMLALGKVSKNAKSRKNKFAISFANIDRSIFFTSNYLFNRDADTEGNQLAKTNPKSKTFKIAVLLPFHIAENLQDSSSSRITFKKNTDKIVEFYEGMLMAVDSMRRVGMAVDLFVYDTEKSDDKVRAILKKPELATVDLIVGPAYNSQIKIVGEFAKLNKVNVVSPLSPNSEILPFNERVFQVKPSEESQIAQVAKYLSLYWDKNLVLAHNGSDEDLQFASTFKKKMSLYFANLSGRDTISFKEFNSKASDGQSLESTLSTLQDNFIIVPSTNESYVVNLLNKLNNLSGKYKILVFGMPEWQRFSNLELEQIHRLQLHYFSNYYIDQQDRHVFYFAQKYSTVFKAQAEQFAFQGFDLMMYFLDKLRTYGKDFDLSLGKLVIAPEKPGLQSMFKFERITPSGGFINTSLFIIRHTKDFEYTKVDPSVRIEYFKDYEILPDAE